MSLYISSLNSGSNGNCYYIGNEEEGVLIDAGISCRETEKRMKRLGLAIEKLKAIFISHEHGDHITGAAGLSRKYQLPVYITPATLQHSGIPLDPSLTRSFQDGQTLSIGKLSVTAFSKKHDAVDPHSFIITQQHTKIGVFTDIGICCDRLRKFFGDCDAVFLESNYCPEMLDKGRYPYHLKKRISGGMGHLSNLEALELFSRHRGNNLQYLILAHLSNNNNGPQLVERLFKEKAGDTSIIVASRFKESEIYRIDKMQTGTTPARPSKQVLVQLSLF